MAALKITVNFDIQGEFSQGPNYKPSFRKEHIYSSKPMTDKEIELKLKSVYNHNSGNQGYWVRDWNIEKVEILNNESED